MYNFANPLCPETQRGNFYKNHRLQTPTSYMHTTSRHITPATLILLNIFNFYWLWIGIIMTILGSCTNLKKANWQVDTIIKS